MTKVCILSSVHIALDNRVFYREAQSLQKAGYEVTLIAVHDKSEIKNHIQIIGLPKITGWWNRYRLWFQVLRLARQAKADIYHFHDPELLLVTPLLRLLTGKPVIYDVHEVYADFIEVKDYMPAYIRFPIAWLFRWLEPLLARLQSGLIFSDDEVAKIFRRIKKPKVTIFNFPAGFFITQAESQIREVVKREPVVLHLGGLERNRGSRLVVAAFAEIHKQRPDARLLLVGHFVPVDLEDEVRKDIRERGIENAVTIAGRVPFETIGRYLSQAAVGWIPRLPFAQNEKNIPTKVFEYMAYGLPVVSSDLRALRPFITEGENGLFAIADDPGDHAKAILKILDNPGRGVEMGQTGQALVKEKWNWEAEEKKLLQFYAALLGSRS